MAERRLFSKKIVESDAFLEMKPQSQLLYFHLCMNADDEGFVNSPKKIAKLCGVSVKNIDELVEKHFLIDFNEIVVIKHWFINNLKRNDRFHKTTYQNYFSKLTIKENGSYSMNKSEV